MLPLILLPGMGGDARMFEPQLAAIPGASVPAWVQPRAREGLAEFAARMARAVDPGGPCFVGGASFGGMVAVEMARHLEARACFLIGSIRRPEELPPRVRLLRPLGRWTGGRGLGLVAGLCEAGRGLIGRWLHPATRSMLGQLADADRRFLRWAALAVLQWRLSAEPIAVPVFQIHGDRDRILPHRFTRPDTLVHGAGHLLSMTHGDTVNRFLGDAMEQLGAG
jgi:pimeloyl-ACP methyl ester carboxylesterase